MLVCALLLSIIIDRRFVGSHDQELIANLPQSGLIS
jgi:hypothetical protein